MKLFHDIMQGWKAAAISVAAAAASIMPSTAQESTDSGRFAVVSLSVNFLRERPDYTAELGTQALMGTIVEIVGEDGYWREVITPEPYRAWCNELGIVEMSGTQLAGYRCAPKYICTAWHSTVYSGPSEASGKICDIVEGDIMRIAYAGGSTARTKAAFARGFAKVLLPDGTEGYVRKGDVQEYSSWAASRRPSADSIIDEALKFKGVPYMWGGASPNGVDCSGFVRHVFLMNGIALPRNASQQAKEGTGIPVRGTGGSDSHADIQARTTDMGYSQDTDGVDIGNFRKGDLLFFGRTREDGSAAITHVGIYIGDGRFIHSSQYVRISSLLLSDEDYYEKTPALLACRRILKP
ncbi:MAG: C40 family peptidase [Bacteroidales bacterium]|nr:C40 family peptidase [Bacteroidales bacterium]